MNPEELTNEEIRIIQKMLQIASGREVISSWEAGQAARMRQHDPTAAVMIEHQPIELGSTWACTCNRISNYVSKTHVIITHIKPIIERAATHKVRDILERAGMDLDVIIQSDKIFGDHK